MTLGIPRGRLERAIFRIEILLLDRPTLVHTCAFDSPEADCFPLGQEEVLVGRVRIEIRWKRGKRQWTRPGYCDMRRGARNEIQWLLECHTVASGGRREGPGGRGNGTECACTGVVLMKGARRE
jgi:hypothetical protein